MNEEIVDIIASIQPGSLRSYTWVALQLGMDAQGAMAAGQVIAAEATRRWNTPADEANDTNRAEFPWWRVIGLTGEVRPMLQEWLIRQVERLEDEGYQLSVDLRVEPLPAGFE